MTDIVAPLVPAAMPRLNEPAPAFSAAPPTVTDRSRTTAASGSSCSRTRPTSRRCAPPNSSASRSAHATFQSLGAELLGLSIDSLFSHLAWTRNIEEKFGVAIPFPIIEDIKMDVARAYGMVHPGAADTQAVRATFFIDPKGILRAMVYYPMSNGRSIPEFVRLLQALQTSDRHGVATPEGWVPGRTSSCRRPRPPPPPPRDPARDSRPWTGTSRPSR
jgi:peroxiredoxin (alkyl hydroperoxide reductase subunit C)